jgi:hypothetical protein
VKVIGILRITLKAELRRFPILLAPLPMWLTEPSVVDPERLISDPDPAFQVISDPNLSLGQVINLTNFKCPS